MSMSIFPLALAPIAEAIAQHWDPPGLLLGKLTIIAALVGLTCAQPSRCLSVGDAARHYAGESGAGLARRTIFGANALAVFCAAAHLLARIRDLGVDRAGLCRYYISAHRLRRARPKVHGDC